jgi:hypothetical protein
MSTYTKQDQIYYYANKEARDKASREWHKNNRERSLEKRKQWRDKNKEKIKERSKEYYWKNKELLRAKKRLYYLEHPELHNINTKSNRIKKQEFIAGRNKPQKCEINSCKKEGKICFDHDHKTGKFRGWLCDNCNRVLGNAFDNPKILYDLSEYLKLHEKINN